MRLVIEQVRVTDWQVEIRLRIPLDDNPGDDDPSKPGKPNSPSPKTKSGPTRNTKRPVSSELRLRSADHRLLFGPPIFHSSLDVVAVRGSLTIRVKTMCHSAELAWRSPDRFGR